MDHLSLSPVVAFVTTNTTRLVILIWDITLTLINLLVPAKRLGHVIPTGHPGTGGKWPKYIAPTDSDSRSACPALNAMANHGILPRDGRNIKFSELSRATHTTFNFAETFCFVVCNFSAGMLSKTYDKGTCDLADLNMHNGIEHDASLTRDDASHQPDQGKPYTPFVEDLLDCATGKDKNGQPKLTARDLSYFMAKRRVEAQKTNPQYSFTMFHRAFSFLKYLDKFRLRNTLQKYLTNVTPQHVFPPNRLWWKSGRPAETPHRGTSTRRMGARMQAENGSDIVQARRDRCAGGTGGGFGGRPLNE